MKRLEKLLGQLRLLRWVVLAVVAVGIAVSVAINVLHAQDNTVARLLSAWPPLALFGAIELISRIPTSGRALSAGRIAGALLVGGVGLAVSYSHMYGEVQKYEGEWQALIWPASVDGLMIVAGLSLIEVVRKIRTIEGEIADRVEQAEREAEAALAAASPVTPAPVPVATPAKPSRQRGTGRARATGAGTRVSEAKRRAARERDQATMTVTDETITDAALIEVG